MPLTQRGREMLEQFTPGPWTVNSLAGKHGVPWAIMSGSQRVAAADKCAEARHNVNLIAAAPDLYAALGAMVDRWEPDTEGSDRRMWETACAALAKARGEKP